MFPIQESAVNQPRYMHFGKSQQPLYDCVNVRGPAMEVKLMASRIGRWLIYLGLILGICLLLTLPLTIPYFSARPLSRDKLIRTKGQP